MRGAANMALFAAASLLGCSPPTAGPGAAAAPTARMASGGTGGRGGAGVIPLAGGAGSIAVGAPTVVDLAGSPAPAAAPPLTVAPAPDGPSAALVRLEPLVRPAAAAKPAGGTQAPSPSGGAAGLGGARPMLPVGSATTQTPPPELCDRLQQAAAMRQRPGNDRTTALLAACAARTQGAAGAAAQGGSGASTGDVPDARERVPLAGTAVFTHAPDGVSLLIVLDGCKDGALYPVHIHAGHGCADANSIGERWDHTRGEDIPDLRCNGAHASQDYTRAGAADKAWTLGGPSVSDVIGHALVINDPDDRTMPIACGVITAP